MTGHIDPRPGGVRHSTYEQHQSGLSYAAARGQAEAEAESEFGAEEDATGKGADNGPAVFPSPHRFRHRLLQVDRAAIAAYVAYRWARAGVGTPLRGRRRVGA